jgi:hypothetical protein
MGILNRGNILLTIVCLLFCRCNEHLITEHNTDSFQKSVNAVGQVGYSKIYNKMKDSLEVWVLNKLVSYEALYTYNYDLDSLICFNKKANRLVCCLHIFGNQFNSTSDDLIFFYGEEINSNWYFFKGADIVLIRSSYQKNIHTPLSYQQLHQIALKEVYCGYLNDKGEINEDWFTNHFENIGFGDFNNQSSSLAFLGVKEKFTDKRKFFEAIHLQSVKNNWFGINKDSIKQLPTKNLP